MPFRLILLALLAAPILRGDTVTLKDGTVREGVITAEDDAGVTLEIKAGGMSAKVIVPRSSIAKLQKGPVPVDPIEQDAARLRQAADALKGGAAADAWVKLGDFFASKAGYSGQAREAYEKALAQDAQHTAAHERLGHVKTADDWKPLADLKRDQGLVPLDGQWLAPDERAWVIDRRRDQADDLNIGVRRNDPFTKADLERAYALKRAEEEAALRNRLTLQYGNSLLARYGYYNSGDGLFIGGGPQVLGPAGATPVYVNGVGLSGPNSEFFVGTVGSDYFRPYGYGGRGRSSGYSPGIVSGNFAFGSQLSNIPFATGGFYGGYGSYSGYSSGYNLRFSGGSNSFRYNVNTGGSSGFWGSRGGFGLFGF